MILISILALFSVMAIAASFYLDTPVRDGIVETQGKGWKKTSVYALNAAVSKYGDWPQLALIGAIGFLIKWRNRDWMKILVAGRDRVNPFRHHCKCHSRHDRTNWPGEGKEIEQGWYGLRHEGRWLVGDPRYNSFPSGHTATAVGFAGVLVFARPGIGAVAVLVAFGIAWSRMYLGRHNFPDVVVSTILALFVAWFSWQAIRNHGERWIDFIKSRFKKAA